MEDDYSWGPDEAVLRAAFERVIRRVERRRAVGMGAVPCPGDHGTALPCPLCGAEL